MIGLQGWYPIVASLGAVGVLLLVYTSLYNRLVTARNVVDAAWRQVDVQLLRRHDLVPNLVDVVKGYAAHERQTLEAVTRARAEAMQGRTAHDLPATTRAEDVLGPALAQVRALSEAYPALKADTQFIRLMGELSDTENRVASARRGYNEAVLAFNESIARVPGNFIAAWAHMTPRTYWALEDDAAARQAPRVAF